MSQSEQLRGSAATASRYDIAGLLKEIGDVPASTEPGTLRRKSRDYFWYSPILNKELHGKSADVIIAPRSEEELIRAVAAAVRRRIPITPRAGATGNYGQAVPLRGGVLLDMLALNKVHWSKPGMARLGVGARMDHVDAALRPIGYELRMHPSTKRLATIGGFICGGSGGVGSVTYGGLREPGNIMAARLVTAEESPRVIELRGDDCQKINRTYGTTGILTELEMPLAPAWDWIELVIAFDDFFEAVAVGYEAALADGIVKKLLTPIIWPIPSYFRDIKAHCPEGKSILICMIAEPSLESFKSLLAKRGTITLERPFDEGPDKEPLYEYTWNHTTLQLLKVDRTVTYLQCLFPHDRLMESVREMWAMFPDEVLPHLELIRFNGRVTCSALPIVRYKSPARLDGIIALFEKHGVMIANPHVYTLEDGSRHKWIESAQIEFKRSVDPHGLLNPGKMRTYQPVSP